MLHGAGGVRSAASGSPRSRTPRRDPRAKRAPAGVGHTLGLTPPLHRLRRQLRPQPRPAPSRPAAPPAPGTAAPLRARSRAVPRRPSRRRPPRSPGGGPLAPGAARGEPWPAGPPRPWLRAPGSGGLGPRRGGGGGRRVAGGGGKRAAPPPPFMAGAGRGRAWLRGGAGRRQGAEGRWRRRPQQRGRRWRRGRGAAEGRRRGRAGGGGGGRPSAARRGLFPAAARDGHGGAVLPAPGGGRACGGALRGAGRAGTGINPRNGGSAVAAPAGPGRALREEPILRREGRGEDGVEDEEEEVSPPSSSLRPGPSGRARALRRPGAFPRPSTGCPRYGGGSAPPAGEGKPDPASQRSALRPPRTPAESLEPSAPLGPVRCGSTGLRTARAAAGAACSARSRVGAGERCCAGHGVPAGSGGRGAALSSSVRGQRVRGSSSRQIPINPWVCRGEGCAVR